MSHIYFLPHAIKRADSIYGGCNVKMERHADMANMIVQQLLLVISSGTKSSQLCNLSTTSCFFIAHRKYHLKSLKSVDKYTYSRTLSVRKRFFFVMNEHDTVFVVVHRRSLWFFIQIQF